MNKATCFYQLAVLEPNKLSYLLPVFLWHLKALAQPPGNPKSSKGLQLLVNVNFKEWSLKKFNVIEEAFATECWLYRALYTVLPESPIICIY